ncbi:hypothetical protein GcM1_130007 [Golovinomyces cichoracearum]|uniref:Uncharacterized protein n=1 Tax=Golovinomyces cichoracearum TaxID=62708 RepID=A0A420JBZ4_9PEZI|nr:hypothetical protein GcM1_130007 [Golovinomyces cichoracearum]
MFGVEETGEMFLKGNVFDLANGYLTFAPYFYNHPLKSPYLFKVLKTEKFFDKPTESDGRICGRVMFNSNTLLESLTKSGKLTSIKTPSIEDPFLKSCLDDIKTHNNKVIHENEKEQNNQLKLYATSILGNPGRLCTQKHIAILAATGLIKYKGEFDCWRGINKPLGFEEFTDPPPLVNADAPLMVHILDHTRNEFYVELNGIPRRALHSSIYGVPVILVNIAPKKFKIIGGVAPRGVKLPPEENIKYIEQPTEFAMRLKNFWSVGHIVC